MCRGYSIIADTLLADVKIGLWYSAMVHRVFVIGVVRHDKCAEVIVVHVSSPLKYMGWVTN